MITQELVKEFFIYENGNLYWKINRTGKAKQGTKAGCLLGKGYRSCKIQGQQFLVHRIIFLYHHGYLPKFIDHINGVKDDNRVENLREATLSQNNSNSKIRSNNTSGIKGVSWDKKSKKWLVYINLHYQRKYIGRYNTIEEAEKAIKIKREELHKEFARNE